MSVKANAKERIMEAMLKMLEANEDITTLTSREIASLSGVNTAMINYYYQSKDNLLNQAVNNYMGHVFEEIIIKSRGDGDAIDRLKVMIKTIADVAIRNFSSGEIAVLFDFKKGSIDTAEMIIPLLKEHFGKRKTDDEIKVIGMQIIIPLQMMFLNEPLYRKYLTLDFQKPEERNKIIDAIIDNIIT